MELKKKLMCSFFSYLKLKECLFNILSLENLSFKPVHVTDPQHPVITFMSKERIPGTWPLKITLSGDYNLLQNYSHHFEQIIIVE